MKTIRRVSDMCRNTNESELVDNLLISVCKILFPQFCIGCNKLGDEICANCLLKLTAEQVEFTICFVCENLCINGKTHKICKPETPIETYFSSYIYQGITKKVLQAKSRQPNLISILLKSSRPGEFIMQNNPEVIIPVPPSFKITKPRFTEPTDIIAKYIRFATGLPVYNALYKPVLSKQQKKLSLKNRKSQIILIKKDTVKHIRNKRILLIDDVCTSGSTLNASANRLKQFGALNVTAYTLAKDLRYNKA